MAGNVDVWYRMSCSEGPVDSDRCAGDVHDSVVAAALQHVEEYGLVGENARLGSVDHVEVEQIRIKEAWRTCARSDRASADCLDIAHGPSELSVDLGIACEFLCPLFHLVDHRVPDGSGVLQPVEIDGAVGAELGEVGGSTVILVHNDGIVGDHHEC